MSEEQQKPFWKKNDKKPTQYLEKVNKEKRVFVPKHEIDFNFLASLSALKRAFYLSKLQSKTGISETEYIKFLNAQEEWKESRK